MQSSTRRALIVPLLALALAMAPAGVPWAAAEMATEATSLNATCSERLNTLWSKYSAPTSFPEGCDAACLTACHATLQDAVYADNAKDCPLQEDIVRCFHVFADDWEEYVSECELFTWVDPATAAVSAEGEAGRRLLAEAVGSGTGCFPEFSSPLDFELFIDGKYWSMADSQPTNTVGVILSVFFWVGLAVMGFCMRH